MGERAVVKTGPGHKADTRGVRRPAPELVTETRLQRMQRSLGNRALGQIVQTRLLVGPAGDRYEQEAERVADEVMSLHGGLEHTGERAPEHADMLVQRAPRTPREAGEDQTQVRRFGPDLEDEEEAARRLAPPNAPVGDVEAIEDSKLGQGGDPLPGSVRAFFEPRFARDFSEVRVHTGSLAEEYTDALHAYAFTYGNHIWMGRGQPVHPSRLLAHELAHVVQQTRPRKRSSHGYPVPEGIHHEAHAPLIRRREPGGESEPNNQADGFPVLPAGTNAPTTGLDPVAPGIRQWRQLPAREPVRIEVMHGGGPLVQRQQLTPGQMQINPPEPEDPEEKWVRLQVFAAGMDHAAQLLANFTRESNRNRVLIGVSPKFVKVYDQNGKSLGARIPLKEVKGLHFDPGVYVEGPRGQMIAVTIAEQESRIGLEAGGSVIGHRAFTEEEKAKQAEEEKQAKAEGRAPKPAPPAVVDFKDLLTDPEQFRSLVSSVSNPFPIYFVPTYVDTAPKRVYASPIEGRGDGEPPNAPPWPVSIDGPKLVPIDSDPTYAAKIDWSAHGNYTVQSQAFAQLGNNIHYRWELCDVTQYAKKQAAEEAAAHKGDPAAKPEKSLDERIEDFKKSKVGTGTDVTGMGGAKREFGREFEDWWKDTKRAAKGTVAPGGTTVHDRLSNAVANRLALELAPVSLLTTAVGAVVRLLADLFAGPRQQQEIPLQKEGIFLVRVITTPAINEDREGHPIIRPPSVAAKVTEVAKMDRAVEEALDEPGAQLAELKAQIDQLSGNKEGNKSKIAYLQSLLAEAEERYTGSPLTVLIKKRKEKKDELDEFKAKFPTLSAYSREREVEMLDDQIALYMRHEKERTETGTGLAPMQRLNATLISEVTGEQYPLLLSAGPMAMEGDKYQWLVSDVTNREGDAFTDIGDTPSAALEAALTKFGGKCAYGRGRIGVRTAGLGLESGAKPTIFVDSAPTDWALAEKRIDDLVTTLAVLGLFVTSAGTAAAVIGAGLAAARLIQRWNAGHLYLDAETVSDALSVLGGLGATLQLAGGLRVLKFEKMFAIAQEGQATEAQFARAAEALKGAKTLAKVVEAANEAINYGGLMWGNLTFLDKMISINEQEAAGAITHAAARRERATAISSAVQNNGLFIAGNVVKAKGHAAKEKPTEPADKPSVPADKPPTEKSPTEEILPEEGDKPAQKAGAPVPIGERQATPAELRAALPADLQSMLIVDEKLQGDHVQAEYTLDPATGLISEIRLRCSPDARPVSVALHVETIRTMQKYQGFSGRVRQAIGWLAKVVGIDTLKPENRSSFEAALEIRKLPRFIDFQMARMRTMEPNARALAEAELDHHQLQLEQHLRTLELGGPGEGVGFVAAKGLSKAKQKQYAELRAKLRGYEPGSEAHKRIRREMYELIGGDLPYETWEKVYASNVERANKANASVTAEQQRLGWGKTEQTINLGRGEVRRLDIADMDPKVRKGVEVKAYETGHIYANEDIVSEVERDGKLVRRGWNITWVLVDTTPSAPLLDMLLKAGITVELRATPKDGGQSTLVTRHEPPARRGARRAQ